MLLIKRFQRFRCVSRCCCYFAAVLFLLCGRSLSCPTRRKILPSITMGPFIGLLRCDSNKSTIDGSGWDQFDAYQTKIKRKPCAEKWENNFMSIAIVVGAAPRFYVILLFCCGWKYSFKLRSMHKWISFCLQFAWIKAKDVPYIGRMYAAQFFIEHYTRVWLH